MQIARSIPTFSKNAVDALRDFLEPNGEMLPLICKHGEFYAYNVTTVANILDRENSEFDWGSHKKAKVKPNLPSDIIFYEFYPDKLNDLSIFRLPERLSDYFVTQRFVDRVYEKNLRGFRFKKVWPVYRPPKGNGIAEMERRAKL